MKRNSFLLCMGLLLVLALSGCTTTGSTGAYYDDTTKDTGSYYYDADDTGNVSGIYGYGDNNDTTNATNGIRNAADDVGDAARDIVNGTGNAISDVGNGIANTVR